MATVAAVTARSRSGRSSYARRQAWCGAGRRATRSSTPRSRSTWSRSGSTSSRYAPFIPTGSLLLGGAARRARYLVFQGITYASLIAAMPRAGGDYVWISRVLGGGIGFVLAVAGWWFILWLWVPIYANILNVEVLPADGGDRRLERRRRRSSASRRHLRRVGRHRAARVGLHRARHARRTRRCRSSASTAAWSASP